MSWPSGSGEAAATPVGACVLTYGGIARPEPGAHDPCTHSFDLGAHLADLAARFCVLPLAHLVRASGSGRFPERAVALTFGDGDVHALREAASALSDLQLPATFFVSSGGLDAPTEHFEDRIARPFLFESETPRHIEIRFADRELCCDTSCRAAREEAHRKLVERARGLDPEGRRELLAALEDWLGYAPPARASHRLLTRSELVDLASRPEIAIGGRTRSQLSLPDQSFLVRETEVREDRACLERAIGRPVELFAYPYGRYDERVVRTVRQAGYVAAVTGERGVLGTDTDPYRVPRVEVRWPPR